MNILRVVCLFVCFLLLVNEQVHTQWPQEETEETIRKNLQDICILTIVVLMLVCLVDHAQQSVIVCTPLGESGNCFQFQAAAAAGCLSLVISAELSLHITGTFSLLH